MQYGGADNNVKLKLFDTLQTQVSNAKENGIVLHDFIPGTSTNPEYSKSLLEEGVKVAYERIVDMFNENTPEAFEDCEDIMETPLAGYFGLQSSILKTLNVKQKVSIKSIKPSILYAVTVPRALVFPLDYFGQSSSFHAADVLQQLVVLNKTKAEASLIGWIMRLRLFSKPAEVHLAVRCDVEEKIETSVPKDFAMDQTSQPPQSVNTDKTTNHFLYFVASIDPNADWLWKFRLRMFNDMRNAYHLSKELHAQF